MKAYKALGVVLLSALLESAIAIAGGPETSVLPKRFLEEEQAAQKSQKNVSTTTVWLHFAVDQSGPNAGINSSVYIQNDTDGVRQVRYERTVNNPHHGGASQNTMHVPAKGRTWIGYTCAFDVSYSTLCGSHVSYRILN